MSDATSTPSSPQDDFDPHRFAVEPKKKFDKKFISIASSLGFIGLAIAGTILLGKWQLTTYFENLTSSRETAQESSIPRPSKATPTKSVVLPKLGEQAESGKSAPDSKNAAEPTVTPPVAAAQPKSVGGAIPVIDEPSRAATTNGNVPVVGKGASRSEGTQNTTVEIPMMLESVAAQASKPVLPSATPSQQSTNSTQNTPSIPVAPVEKPRTVEALAAIKAGQTAISATAQSTSANVGDRSRVILRGSYIECVLESQLISNIPGITSCVVPTNVYSDNGKRLLIRKGSKLVGEYSATVKIGDSRFGVMWQRVKTPEGVVIDVDSGAADSVGGMGLNGAFDMHWAERLGAAFMFSIIADGISTLVEPRSTSSSSNGNVVVQPSATVDTAQNLAKAQIQSSLAIAPTFFKNRGDRVSVFVNRDLWFQ